MEPKTYPTIRCRTMPSWGRWLQLSALATATTITTGLPLVAMAGDPLPQNDTKNVSVETFAKAKVRFVHTHKLIVRSGPSERYYSTSTLEKGSRVEVYLETSDGWSGIRPPEGSHNWIPASSAYLLPGGNAVEVMENDTAAWVGSDQNDMSQLQWQTALAKGQTVQVLGEEHQKGEDGTKKLWYRIAPPQGEFRWVRTNSLSNAVVSKDASLQGNSIAKDTNEKNSLDIVGPAGESAQSSAPIAKQGSSRKNSPSKSDSQVMPASFQTEVPSPANEGIVWSNEKEVLADVERQIRSEQVAARSGVDVSTSSNSGMESYSIDEGDEVDEIHTSPELTPISAAKLAKAEAMRAKRHKAAAHQIDSFQHWDKLQASGDKKLRVGPLASVLGLVGLGVVEAERAPVATRLAHAQQQNKMQPYGESLGHMGPPGSSRLDRLPRPGRRPQFTSPNGYGGGVGSRPLDPNDTVLTRLWNADQPLFGSTNAAVAQSPTQDPYSWPSANSLMQDPSLQDPLPNEWHGIHSRQASSVATAMNRAYSEPLSEAEFGTPEVQQAMLELSRVVSRPTEQWDLESLRAKTQHWIETGDTAIVRGEARLLMERLERFESLRTRTLGGISNSSMLASNGVTPPVGRDTWVPSAAGNPAVNNPSSVIPASAVGYNPQPGAASSIPFGSSSMSTTPSGLPREVGQGEASGWLVQVHTTLPGQPEFALTDDAGKVITYVQSTAALNLRRYLQQPVIVHGVRGYIPALAARQIVAERVVRLK